LLIFEAIFEAFFLCGNMHGHGGLETLIFNKDSPFNLPGSPTDRYCGTKPKVASPFGMATRVTASSIPAPGSAGSNAGVIPASEDVKKNPWGNVFKSKQHFLDMHLA